MQASVIEAVFLTSLPTSRDGELMGDLVRRIRSVRARHSTLDPIHLAAKEADLTKAWMDRRGTQLTKDVRERFLSS
jgi:hypothetical protein